MQIRQNPKEFEKVGFAVFAILRNRKWAWPNRKVIQLHSGNLGIQGFWMCDIRFGSYRQKRVFLGYSAPCRRIYVVFCVWDIRRSLDQPSKLQRPPLHGLACSTTFSRRKIKIKIVMITIGFLAPLVLPSAPRAWPPNNNNGLDLYGTFQDTQPWQGSRFHSFTQLRAWGMLSENICKQLRKTVILSPSLLAMACESVSNEHVLAWCVCYI